MKERPLYVLEGNIIEHLRKINDMRNQANMYFHFGSKLWRAVERHIALDPDQALATFPQGMSLRGGRNTYGINRRECGLYAQEWDDGKPVQPIKFWVEFSANLVNNEEEEFSRNYSVNVPIDLELNFTEDKFKAWTDALKKERDNKINAKEFEEYQRLKAKFGKKRRKP